MRQLVSHQLLVKIVKCEKNEFWNVMLCQIDKLVNVRKIKYTDDSKLSILIAHSKKVKQIRQTTAN